MILRYPLVIGAEFVVLTALAYAIAVFNISHPDPQQITIDTLSGMVERLEREHAN